MVKAIVRVLNCCTIFLIVGACTSPGSIGLDIRQKTQSDPARLIVTSRKHASLEFRSCSGMLRLTGERYSCGYLVAPENYASDQSRTIKVPFLVIFPEQIAANQYLTPVLVTGGGGPGSPQLGNKYQYPTDDTYKTYEAFSVANGRALIIMDNRGVGFSEPELECHYQPELLQTDYWTRLVQANEACGNEFRINGTDLSQYNTRNAVLDIELFRQLYAMQGVNTAQLNLYGISYGTHIAMHYEKMFPAKTRSLVLDSVVTNKYNATENLLASLRNGQRSLDMVFENCRASAPCLETFGEELEMEFYHYLAALDAQQITLDVDWPNRTDLVSVPLTASTVVAGLHGALYSGDTIATIPLMIRRLIDGSYDEFTAYLSESYLSYDFRSPFADLAFLTYLCHDQDFAGTVDLPWPDYKLFNYWDLENNRRQTLDFCTAFDIESQPGYSAPHTSGTPTLMLSGNFDPVTPPSNASQEAAKYAYHWDLVFENVSHDVISHSACARNLASWFIYHLEEDLDGRYAECELDENRLDFELE